MPNESPQARPGADVTYDRAANTIQFNGPGSIVTLTDIHFALGNDDLLERTSTSEWYLKANLLIDREVRFLLHGGEVGGDVDWLKLKSDPSGFVWVKTFAGQISMNATRVSSWDKQAGTFDTVFSDWGAYQRDLKENATSTPRSGS